MTNIATHTRRPDITFRANGTINITARISKLLDLRQGDVINIAMERGEYLLYVSHRDGSYVGKYEGTVFPSSRRDRNNMRAHSRALCTAMLQAAGATQIARLQIGIPISINGSTYLPIIYRHIL